MSHIPILSMTMKAIPLESKHNNANQVYYGSKWLNQ